MTGEQHKAALSLKVALGKVARAGLALRVFDGGVWVVPNEVDLWPHGSEGNVIAILDDLGADVSVPGLDADGGAGV